MCQPGQSLVLPIGAITHQPGQSLVNSTYEVINASITELEPAAKAKNAEFDRCLVTNQSFDSGSRIRFSGDDLANGLCFAKPQVSGLYVFTMSNAQ